jgi:hypothetical protein
MYLQFECVFSLKNHFTKIFKINLVKIDFCHTKPNHDQNLVTLVPMLLVSCNMTWYIWHSIYLSLLLYCTHLMHKTSLKLAYKSLSSYITPYESINNASSPQIASHSDKHLTNFISQHLYLSLFYVILFFTPYKCFP